jgi:hypothetical protein
MSDQHDSLRKDALDFTLKQHPREPGDKVHYTPLSDASGVTILERMVDSDNAVRAVSKSLGGTIDIPLTPDALPQAPTQSEVIDDLVKHGANMQVPSNDVIEQVLRGADDAAAKAQKLSNYLRELDARAKLMIAQPEIFSKSELQAIRDECVNARAHTSSVTSSHKPIFFEALSMIIDRLPVVKDETAGAGKVKIASDRRLPIAADGARELRIMDKMSTGKEIAKSGRSLTHVVTEIMEQTFPGLLAKFYPRQYQNVGAYHSPKVISTFLANVVSETTRYGFDRAPTAYRLMLPGMRYMIDHKMPMFFISPDMLKAIMLTKFDNDIDWVNMKLPFESAVFVLPTGGCTHPEDGDLACIMWNRAVGGTTYQPPVSGYGLPPITVENTSLALVGLCTQTGVWYDACLSAKERPTLQLRNLFYRQPGEAMRPIEKSVPGLDEDLVAETDAPFIENLGVIVFGTLLAMQARPDLIDAARLDKVVQHKGGERKEFWYPNIIGKRYKIRREVPSVKSGQFQFKAGESKGGTHASPRAHWRCGHFRHQAYGPKSTMRKQIWLEPVYVCPMGEEEKK